MADFWVDAGLCLFDCREFRERVVPAFRRLHADDEVEPWLAEVWRSAGIGSGPVPRFTPHVRQVTAPLMATADLTGFLPAELVVPDPPRPKRRGRGGPPAPVAVEGRPEWEALCDLMLAALEQTCLGEGVVVASETLHWGCVDSPKNVPPPYDLEVRQPVEWLEERSTAWTTGDPESPVGVRGWLDADESWLLADALSGYQLVHRAATFAEIGAARHAPGATCSDGADHPWQLATLRSVAAIAAERRQGVAFGWNVVPAPR
jgi:hypothetical protein